ncbi:pur operon repressor [Clostridium sp. 19966]|uniref:pur operon repressor n=1 Tax=Clostridium sp. 19966 TaxID=2768166 RepID=UPI0028E09A0C|nr:pur operon repressor [Clostridium sp. 19966]MDT8715732.1 pur operon repressor [Clostridium sp. 19966]
MDKFNRNSRICAITKMLLDKPNKVLSLNTFTDKLNAAKSTVSEDIVVIKNTFNLLEEGMVETISGASGGVKYVVGSGSEEAAKFAKSICDSIADSSRIIPGNYIYMTDIMYNPAIISKAGTILAACFNKTDIDYVVTVETKGIPLAYEVAKNLGVQLVIVRRDNNILTEGPTVTINYVSGTSGRIQNMSLARRSIKKGSKCVFIDDFMKAGGTALGIMDLLKEFESELIGIGVLVDNVNIRKKLIADYTSLVEFFGIDDDGKVIVSPSKFFK